jgi:cell wall-associated NlpC family hydrolase
MVTAAQFIEKVKIPLQEGWGYIYGTWGVIWTQAKQDASTRDMTVKYGSKWIGKHVTDCSGLIRRALYWLGEEIVHHARYQYTDYCTNKGKLVNGRREDGTLPLPGSAVFLQGSETKIHHVGVYVGGDTVIEAKGTVYGVVTSHLNHWDHWGELKMVDYTDAAALEVEDAITHEDTQEDATAGTIVKGIISNPNRFLNVRSAGNSSAKVEFQVEKGSIVEILDAGEPDWWQIRYGGRIGWAAAKYITPMVPEKEDAPESPETPLPDADEPDAQTPSPVHVEQIEALLQAVDSISALLSGMQEILAKLKEGAEP